MRSSATARRSWTWRGSQAQPNTEGGGGTHATYQSAAGRDGAGEDRSAPLPPGKGSVIAVAHPAAVGGEGRPEEAATVIRFLQGKVTTMHDHRTKEEALAVAR